MEIRLRFRVWEQRGLRPRRHHLLLLTPRSWAGVGMGSVLARTLVPGASGESAHAEEAWARGDAPQGGDGSGSGDGPGRRPSSAMPSASSRGRWCPGKALTSSTSFCWLEGQNTEKRILFKFFSSREAPPRVHTCARDICTVSCPEVLLSLGVPCLPSVDADEPELPS